MMRKGSEKVGFKPFPIGVDNFKEMIQEGYYYVDKTLLIKELLDMRGKVNLFTRPRRHRQTWKRKKYQSERSFKSRTTDPK